MNRKGTYLSMAAGSVFVLFLGAILGSRPSTAAPPDKTQDVNIVSPLPLPVTASGTVAATQQGAWNVGVTGPVAVTVGNSPTVALAAGSTVNVTNPAATPLFVLNVNDPGRIAYQSTVNNVGKCAGTSCVFTFPTVPPGHRVVVQHIGGIVDFNAVPTNISVLVETGGGGFVSEFFAPIPTGFLFSSFDQPVLFYVDALQPPLVEVFLAGGGATFSGDSTSQFVTLTGYELDCGTVPCAPIAH